MSRFRVGLRKATLSSVAAAMVAAMVLPCVKAQEAPSASAPPAAVQHEAETEQAQAQTPAQPPMPPPPVPGSNYDKAIFQKTIPQDQLAFLKGYAGASSDDLYRDKQFRKLMKSFVPDCMFHYGRDKPLSDALDEVFDHSRVPVQIRDGRYLLMSGLSGPILGGRGFLWIDLQDGLGMGAFYFHPTNGEPTPALNVFSRQIKSDYLRLSELPPEFAQDLFQWSSQSRVPPVLSRYFLTGGNKKVLLEHDEEFCLSADGSVAPPDSGCEQMDADAADLDMTAAEYVDETHHATNATAWMLNDPSQIAWIQVRDRTCGVGPDPLRCRIRMSRERLHVIVRRR